MNTLALNEVLETLRSINLTSEERQWLVSHLTDEASQIRPKAYEIEEQPTDMLREETPLQTYTMEEINAMIDESEQQMTNGEYYTMDEVHHMMDEFVKYQAVAV